MSYNIMRTAKIKDRQAITSAASHNFRIRQQGNIDASRTPLNRVLWNPMKVDLRKADALQKAITGRYEALGAKERKNSVLAQEFIISASPDFFDGLSDEKVAIWAEHQLKFMKNEFGDNLQVAVLHLDEKTPHLHFLLSCEEKSLKVYKNRHGTSERETYSLNAKRWGPDFLRDLHTRHAEHNEKLGLKRGNPSSGAVHKPLKDYYKELEQLRLRMEGRVNQLEMVPEMVGIIEVLADAIEQLDPPNQHLAKVARFASRIATKAKSQEHGGQPPNPRFGGGGGDGRSRP